MARLSRKLRVCKWAGTVVCVLIVGAFVWNAWNAACFIWVGQEHDLVMLGGGWISFQGSLRSFDAITSTHWWLWHDQKPIDLLSNLPRLPSIRGTWVSGYRVDLPLWLPFLILLVPTLLLWRRDRRKPHPGFCPRCDYDLTGNTTGRCPECGLDIPKPPTLSEPAPHE